MLGHVLTASTNPQEVLDAGNWLIENQDLPGDQLDTEAGKLGLSPSVRALVQFPEVMDLMCMKMDWTTELGQAFTADQAAVLDAVQRLRMQAKDVGNLESSAQLKVETESQDGKEIVTVEPPNPDVVYVPKYDPTGGLRSAAGQHSAADHRQRDGGTRDHDDRHELGHDDHGGVRGDSD